MIELSDDDESFTDPKCSKAMEDNYQEAILLSSDDETSKNCNMILSSDSECEELPAVNIKQQKDAIANLFPVKMEKGKDEAKRNVVSKVLFPVLGKCETEKTPPLEKLERHYKRPIGGVDVLLPVEPYGCQVALIFKIIKGLTNSQNCILESPTGSGKTLALLCGVLSWQQHEQKRIGQEQAKNITQAYFNTHPELQNKDVMDYISYPVSKKTDVTPEKLFSKTNFGGKSIYEKTEDQASTSNKRSGPYIDKNWESEEPPTEGLVSIHKKRRQGSIDGVDVHKLSTQNVAGSSETIMPVNNETPEKMRVPTIYYGARTHTQLQQVIKEFKRTAYCGVAKMTILSARDKSCIREFSRDQWSTKNDMCRACIKSISSRESSKTGADTNCVYYDNRRKLNHFNLPPAFDLEELVAAGKEKDACPYYGAREMAQKAEIIFCPYNYLIDPSIKSSLHIQLEGSIIVIDEAHNIESICMQAASGNFTHLQIKDARKELEKVAESRYQNTDFVSYIDTLVASLKNWDDWFEHQIPLLKDQPLNDNKAVHAWETAIFVETLNNHNIGYNQYNSFQQSSEMFCRQLREDPRTLLGVSQATGTLLEALSITLGYLFREECRFVNDFKPILERKVPGDGGYWRRSNYNQATETAELSLNLHCLNPAIVMSTLHVARSVILASGTLTPMGNIHAELGTLFPQQVSPNHVIPDEQVWVGVVSGDRHGTQEYSSRAAKTPLAAERLARLLRCVCDVTPHGVLCFMPSYTTLNTFINIWKNNNVWEQFKELKYVFCEKRNSTDHETIMKEFYECVATKKGALLFAVYRGKVSEGMDFKDDQARAVICVGIPYPNTFDAAVKAKMEYNTVNKSKGLLPDREWLRVQAFRALNQAAGRAARHRGDWGAVLLADARHRGDWGAVLLADARHRGDWGAVLLADARHRGDWGAVLLADARHRGDWGAVLLADARHRGDWGAVLLADARHRGDWGAVLLADARHRGDWGAVLLADARHRAPRCTQHLSKWLLRILGNNHHTLESLESSDKGLAAFIERMKIAQEETDLQS